MGLRLRRIHIDRFGPLRDYTLEPDALTVVEADNEGGKSSIVDALDAWLRELHKARVAVWGGRVGRPGFDEGTVEVELEGGDLPGVLLDNPILLNLLVIPEGRASSRQVGTAKRDWLEEAKQHLAGFDPDPYRRRLRERGGLTPTGKDSRDWTQRGEQLESLGDRITRFLEAVDVLAAREAELREVRGRREAVERELDLERRAVDFDRYRRASAALQTLEQAREALSELERFRAVDLEAWRGLDRERAEASGAEQAAATALAEVEPEVERARSRAREVEGQRNDARDTATVLLGSGLGARAGETARRLREAAEAFEAARPLRPLWIAASALGAAGATAGLLADRPAVAALGFLLVAIGAAFLGRVGTRGRRLQRARRETDSLVADARRAGLDCDSAEAVMVEIEAAGHETVRAEERLVAARARAEDLASRCTKRREVLREARRVLAGLDDRIRELRDRTGLASLEDLESRVSERGEQQRRREDAETTLAELFPDSPPAGWRAAVEGSRVDDPGRRPTPGRLQQLDGERAALRRDERRLEGETEGAVRDGLLELGQPDLAGARDALVRARDEQREREIDRRAARLALDAIDEAERDVERHLDRALESPEDGAGSLFGSLTAGRWSGVRRDGGRLLASAPNGLEMGVESLSRGTRDQLHFALRVALAERILGEPGFFVWDDTFLTSDRERRRLLVETTASLVERGWQVIYLTVDRSIGDLFERAAGERALAGFRRASLPQAG